MGLEASKPLAAAPRVPPDAPADADDPEPWNMLLRLALKVRAPHLGLRIHQRTTHSLLSPPPPPSEAEGTVRKGLGGGSRAQGKGETGTTYTRCNQPPSSC
jgi:hypothetical protein